MSLTGIYKIQSKIKPERIYIGSALNTYKREKQHFSDLLYNKHGNKRLQNHYNKYGKDDLFFSIIVGCTKESLISYEQFYIDAINPFFNIRQKAESNLGIKYSDEVRRKLSESHIGLQSGEKHPLFGKHHSEVSKRKMSISHQGRITWNKGKKGVYKTSEETKEKMRIASSGKKHTEASKQKMRKPKSVETKLKMSEAQKGNKNCLGVRRSDETRRKMSEARKNRIKCLS